MIVEILSMTHDITTLLFGIYISAFFLGIRQNRRNSGILFLFFCCEGLLSLFFSLTVSGAFSRQIYPLIIHLPLVFFFIYIINIRCCPASLLSFRHICAAR